MEILFIMSEMCNTHLSPVYLNNSPCMHMAKCKFRLFPSSDIIQVEMLSEFL